MRNARLAWLVVVLLVFGLSVALGQQRGEEKVVEQKTAAEAKRAEAVNAAKADAAVYLRGDALGVHLNYVPSASQMPAVRGALVRIDPEWVVLSRGGKEILVPRAAVLMIETGQ